MEEKNVPFYLEGLNEKQREAVLTTEGPLLILAGAGAGKTKTVTHRILNIIKKGVSPKHILAITFTNKAAKEMRERTLSLLKKSGEDGFENPFISTFHSLGVAIIKEQGHLLGLPRHFAIFDRGDSKSAIKQAMEERGIDPKQFDPAKMLSAISKEKGNGVFYEEFSLRDKGYSETIVGNIWESYEAILQKEKALDFDDLLLKTLELLRKEEVRAYYNSLWRYIHIDEYQDTNRVQYEIAKILAKEHKNIAVVGDIDQSIYSWRGADFKNILRFEKDYPDTKLILLEENYRSTQNILAVANAIIAKNTLRKDKNLFTKNAEGDLLSLYVSTDEKDEAFHIAKTAQMLISQGANPEEIAVLYRANFQSRVLEEAFLTLGISYDLIGTKFFERKEIKDAIAYLRLALNPELLSDFKRVLVAPAKGIGKVTLLKILSTEEEFLDKKIKEKLLPLRTLLSEIKNRVETKAPSDTIKHIIQASGLESMYKTGKDEDLEKLENLKELVTIATAYDVYEPQEGIEKFLEHVSLSSDQDELDQKKEGVKLMTVHAAKGLEFDYVCITGLEAGLFPHERMGAESNLESEEEERRLFYVAVTRARKKIYLSYASTRMIFGSRNITIPSEFLLDIDDAFLIRENSSFYSDNFGRTSYNDGRGGNMNYLDW